MRSHVIHIHLQKHLLRAFLISGYLDISLSFIQYLIISYIYNMNTIILNVNSLNIMKTEL